MTPLLQIVEGHVCSVTGEWASQLPLAAEYLKGFAAERSVDDSDAEFAEGEQGVLGVQGLDVIAATSSDRRRESRPLSMDDPLMARAILWMNSE
eukprot:CAMPEP_0174741700 /NCGR_PEP_ID=MMETSP1094-20130205/77000_1 /TAXON_ID=156173 /ORGANISM="Chrysochromulina brevifilum, Strain UTEX LB 985" /LENGTH=93 /DNA_ID=CAMNT_0015945627 /DNA_START=50 /DNA_END=330 /DNA_ORIENTATION=-